MVLKRADSCSGCSVEFPAGTRAQWDSDARLVTCVSCVDDAPHARSGGPVPALTAAAADPGTSPGEIPIDVPDAPIDTGTPGASARKEHERRRAKREQQIEDTWGSGRFGRLAKFLSDDPQTTKAWKQGAEGEERVAKVLHERLGTQAVLLHDRKVPGTRGNIDHLAIASSGVWIIDAKKFKGKVQKEDAGGFFKSDIRLYVGGRDRTKSVAGLQWQHDAVRRALGDENVEVHRTLSFVDAEWPAFFAKPFQLDGVWVSWPRKLPDLIAAPGPLAEDDVERIARLLAERLPAN